IDATQQIVRRLASVRVLVLSMHADEVYVTRALKAGAHGYLLKESADTDLFRAVAALTQHKSFFSPAVSRVMLDDYVRQLASSIPVGLFQLVEAIPFRGLKNTASTGCPETSSSS